VEDNIALGDVRREKNREDVIRAAKQGNVDDFVQKLADGYDSPLMRHFEDNGIELSGGQWQKLSVARAFYKESDILILDEPTSALDALAEQEVFHEFSQLSRNKIAVFVSHRLSSATMADKIVVIDGGVVTEVGSHAELMAAKGTYYLLFTTQASRYRDDYVQKEEENS
jgi:ABC-type multidrug transport system fused ATPase/permease subunit